MSQDVVVSVREFARLVGKSHTWIRTLIKRGEIAVDERGQVYLDQGLATMGERATEADLTDIRYEIQKARLEELTYRVELMRLELEDRRAAVTPTAEVKADVERVRRIVAEEITRDIKTVSAACVGLSARAIEGVLEDWLNQVIKRANGRI